ncbi:DUF302 domain-containing protein [Kiritimatiella glycovorans]|uniref:DUF302 domain-containing protein n=1 Tax=Kiritimatiella glycovorans TaxID=1307763 RepID=A0A0G3EAS6_9BACT|nr:DUF302 domain-containing protein [Kiritimatiella glycovorans]AKJ63586.1 hypothetical protein L21SP4_00305 [Kiritimatiella glycovorans]
MKNWKSLLIGLIAGAAATAALGWMMMPGMMILTHRSPYGLEKTVETLVSNYEKGGWTVQRIMNIEQSLEKQGKTGVRPVRVIKACRPDYAAEILSEPEARRVAVMMPCSIAVYEQPDGEVYVSAMNVGLVGRMFGGTIAKVMGGPVAEDEHGFTAFLRR